MQCIPTKEIEDVPLRGKNKSFFLELIALEFLSVKRKMARELNAGSIANAIRNILQFCWLG